MPITTVYKRFFIKAFEREPGRWRAEIRRTDGVPTTILLSEGPPQPSVTTSADTFDAQAALRLAEHAIDGGGMK